MSMRRILNCILLPAYVASCTSWHVEPVSPVQVVTQQQPSTIRITLNDGSRFELDSLVVSGDTLLGLVKRDPAPVGQVSYVQRAVLLADIVRVEIKKVDALKTAAGVVGLALLVFVVAQLVETCPEDQFIKNPSC